MPRLLVVLLCPLLQVLPPHSPRAARLNRRLALPQDQRQLLRSWACVLSFSAEPEEVVHQAPEPAQLPSSLFRDVAVAAVAAVPAENMASGTSQFPCASAACRPAASGTLHPVIFLYSGCSGVMRISAISGKGSFCRTSGHLVRKFLIFCSTAEARGVMALNNSASGRLRHQELPGF